MWSLETAWKWTKGKLSTRVTGNWRGCDKNVIFTGMGFRWVDDQRGCQQREKVSWCGLRGKSVCASSREITQRAGRWWWGSLLVHTRYQVYLELSYPSPNELTSIRETPSIDSLTRTHTHTHWSDMINCSLCALWRLLALCTTVWSYTEIYLLHVRRTCIGATNRLRPEFGN